MPIFTIDIEVSQDALDAGCLEMLAKSYGWRPKIMNEQMQEIDNPVSAEDACREGVKAGIRERVLGEYVQKKADEARIQAENEIKAVI